MALIQRGELVERIRRAFGLMEAGVGSTISPEVVPVVLVDDLTGPSLDEGYPRDCAGWGEEVANVGWASVILENPAASRVDLIIKEFFVHMLTDTTDVAVKTGVVANLDNLLDINVGTVNLDRRVELVPNARTHTRDNGAQLTADLLYYLFVTTASEVRSPGDITLPPGTFMEVGSRVALDTIYVRFHWVERLTAR